MDNFTDVDLEIAKIAYRQGLNWGKTLKQRIDDGVVDINKPIHLKLPIGNIDITNFSYKTRLFIALGSPRAIMTGNTIIVGAGVSILGELPSWAIKQQQTLLPRPVTA